MKPLDVVIVGTGMYVCGRGTDTFGTVLPAVAEWSKHHPLGSLEVVGTDPQGLAQAKAKIQALQQQMGLRLSVRYRPEGTRRDPVCYREALGSVQLPACAIVAVPDDLHREIAGATIEAGLHTLVVKPLAPTLKEARELVELQQRYQRYGAVEFHKRLDRANLALRDAIASGRLGDPLYIVVEYSQRKSVPAERFRKWVAATNSFQYLGVHYVDLLYFATGALPQRVMATGQKGWLHAQGIDTYDAIAATIEWGLPSGQRFVSHLLTSWVDPESTSAMSDQTIRLIGTKGRIESDQKRRGLVVVSDARGIEEPNPDFCAAYGEEGRVSYRGYGIESIHQFLDDVQDIEAGRVSIDALEAQRPTFQQALVSTAVSEAVKTSLNQDSAWVAVEEALCHT